MPPADAEPWGDSSRHYASPRHGESAARSGSPSDLEKRWVHLVHAAMPQAREHVEQAFRQWNGIVREQLRNEMGLRLSIGTESQAVPVRIVDGLPRPLAESLETFPKWEWLILHRPDVEATVRGAELLAAHREQAEGILRDRVSMASASSLAEVAESAEQLLATFDELDAIKRIVDCREDVLGAYCFRIPEVRLYWVPISIVSRLLGVPVEAMTLVVLVHELAHAYSHRGRDIDGEGWSTEHFAGADMAIVEGIAQFYAQVICEGLKLRFPAAHQAFEALLAKQSGPYIEYREWVDRSEPAGEIMRVAMVECRSREVGRTSEFVDAIDRHRQQVKGRPAKSRSTGSASVAPSN